MIINIPIWIYTLKVNIHCDGCKRKVKKILQKIEGVYTVDIGLEHGKVTVSGNVDPSLLIKKLAKSRKHAEIWDAPKENQQMSDLFKSMQIDDGKDNGGNNKNEGQKDGGGGKGGQIPPQMMKGAPQIENVGGKNGSEASVGGQNEKGGGGGGGQSQNKNGGRGCGDSDYNINSNVHGIANKISMTGGGGGGGMRPMGAVKGLPVGAPLTNGGVASARVNGYFQGAVQEAMVGNSYNQQQLADVMMNQQQENGNKSFQHMMYPRPPPTVNKFQPSYPPYQYTQAPQGVYNEGIDSEHGKVTVSGNVGPSMLIKKLAESGKHTAMWDAPKENQQMGDLFKSMQIGDGGNNKTQGQKGDSGAKGGHKSVKFKLSQSDDYDGDGDDDVDDDDNDDDDDDDDDDGDIDDIHMRKQVAGNPNYQQQLGAEMMKQQEAKSTNKCFQPMMYARPAPAAPYRYPQPPQRGPLNYYSNDENTSSCSVMRR